MNSNDEFERWLTETIDEDDYDSVRRNRFIWDAAIEARKAKDLAAVEAVKREMFTANVPPNTPARANIDGGQNACDEVVRRITATE